ncbi:fungal-specific transcription factor domain-containing protein [Cadophora sp. MPI-SDFR-AT-0126]|nr:fungal-specific transcription factor domain-containing protein [Leotiomycetes sp. MPI-SDFR-AT-0126]
MQACDSCYRRKSKCDRRQPCAYCQKAQVQCVYTERTREPAIRQAYIEALEKRLHQSEAKNKALASELAKAKTLHPMPTPSDGFVRPALTPESGADQSSAVGTTVAAEDVTNEVKFLASTAAGERYYLGSASGLLFADLVKASVEISSPGRRHAPNEDSPEDLDRAILNNASAFREALPPQELARKLVSSYLAHDHLCYPFLTPDTLLSIVECMYSNSSFYQENAYESFVFDLVLAIATANVYKFDWQMLPNAETHHLRAMSHITKIFQAGDVKCLQAILLLCQYRTGSSMKDTSASMWHLVGIAVRIAYELGLHRESTYTLKRQSEGTPEYLMLLKERETRRRCFWSLFAMDRIVGITLGRPFAMNLDDIDVELPSQEYDHVFHFPVNGRAGEPSVNRTAIFVHITQYRILCGRLIKSLHGLKPPEHDKRKILETRDKLLADLDIWRGKTKDLKLLDMNLESAMSQDRSSFQSNEWYEVLYANAMLFLFRPSPMLADSSRDATSLQKIYSSSKKAITLYAYLHRSRKINYSWITLHAVFMAGLSYVYAISRHFKGRRSAQPGSQLDSDPSITDIINDTRACSQVLVAISERWNAIRQCHEVFDRLSDAVLGEAIKLQCTPPASLRLSSPGLVTRSSMTGTIDDNHYLSASELVGDNTAREPMTSSFSSSIDHSMMGSDFRSYFDDLQNEPIMQLSQEWLWYIDNLDGTVMQGIPDPYATPNYQ